jgi:hypothetical protein
VLRFFDPLMEQALDDLIRSVAAPVMQLDPQTGRLEPSAELVAHTAPLASGW